MLTVDYIFTNAIVLTMDPRLTQYNPGAVAISGNKIAAVGPQEEILLNHSGGEVIDCQGKVLMPGLINGHTHVPMNLLRGLADDLRLDVWLQGYMLPVERQFVSPDFVRLGTLLACAELIRSGVTTFCDMYYFEEEVAKGAEQAGLRAICGETILKFPTPDAQSYEEALTMTRDFIQRWKGHPRIIATVAPHAPYTCTEEILRACAQLAVKFDVPLLIHIAETRQELEASLNEHGMPVVPYTKKMNIFDAKVIAAHCVHIDEGEMHTMHRFNASIVHNPSSNLKLGSGIAPVKRMLDLGLDIGIGTDGVASNNDLDMFEEMRLASFIAKGSTSDPTVLPAVTVLQMATCMGAKALHLDHLTGSLQPGKAADLILVDIEKPHNIPNFRRDPAGIYAQLVYAAKSTDVTDVMIDGQIVFREQKLLTLQEDELFVRAQDYARQIDAFLLEREGSVLAKLIAIGGTSEEESFEVQVKIPLQDIRSILDQLDKPDIEILRQRHYKEYDTYFSFDDRDQGWLRYREDHFIAPNGEVTHVRNRLTHIGVTGEHHFPQQVLLSRSRFIAPATQSLRFYREYFKPSREFEIDKERLRFLIRYQDTEFYINLDTMITPAIGAYLEVKSRTWSRKDAEHKSEIIPLLVAYLGVNPEQSLSDDYIEMVK
ncbi:MAG: amidohydrolase [Anaerolineaceae bacterium]|nr:amidohydrolase [Anaerolineaceae bacterium]